jgi:hypothetical protein
MDIISMEKWIDHNLEIWRNGKFEALADRPAWYDKNSNVIKCYFHHSQRTCYYDFDTGHRHRIYGPAIEYLDGRQEWYFQGKKIDCTRQEN